MNGTLECLAQEHPHPYQASPGGFSRHLQSTLFPPWIIGRNFMTAWEARIVGAEWAQGWCWWCAATRPPETPAERYAAVPLMETAHPTGTHNGPRGGPKAPMGTQRPRSGCVRPQKPIRDGGATYPGSSGSPSPPRLVLHAAKVLPATEIRGWERDAATV